MLKIKFLIVILLSLYFTSCSSNIVRPSSLIPESVYVANLVMHEWTKAGQPFNRTCWKQVGKSKTYIIGDNLFLKWCKKLPVSAGGNLLGCHTEDSSHPLIILDEGMANDKKLKILAHEYLHLLGPCSMHPLGADVDHKDSIRWEIILPEVENQLNSWGNTCQ